MKNQETMTREEQREWEEAQKQYKHYNITIRATEEKAKAIQKHLQDCYDSHYKDFGSFSREWGFQLALCNEKVLKEDNGLWLNVQGITEYNETEREEKEKALYNNYINKAKARNYDTDNQIEYIALYNEDRNDYKILYIEHYPNTNRKLYSTCIEHTKDKEILADYGLHI